MATYSIKDLELMTGIKAHTIRIWEKRYHLIKPGRTETNIRMYDDEDLKKLLNVAILNRHGIKISRITKLSKEEINEKIVNLSQGATKPDSQIDNLLAATIELNDVKFDKLFTQAVINMGFEQAVIRLLIPFFERIGILWQTGAINPAQEHFITYLIRQKMIVAIEGLPVSTSDTAKSFLLFLPEGEYHEMGLLFYYYVLKKAGYRVVYLGQSVPFDGLVDVAQAKNVDYILASVVSVVSPEKTRMFMKTLTECFKDKKVYFTGQQAISNSYQWPDYIKVIHDITELKEELTRLSAS
jgi:DNA-binding transcriptional MerR regulator